MWLLLPVSVLAAGLFFERFMYLHRSAVPVVDLLRGLSILVRQNRFAEAVRECQASPGPVARVLRAILVRHDLPREEIREAAEAAARVEARRLEGYLPILATVAHVTPLVGLLGTVTGLLQAYQVISLQGGVATAADLSAGLYNALLTTAGSLVVAVPAFLMHSYLCSRVNLLLDDIEQAAGEMVPLLVESRARDLADKGIISFAEAARSLEAAVPPAPAEAEKPPRRARGDVS